jgi:hypothetical protein
MQTDCSFDPFRFDVQYCVPLLSRHSASYHLAPTTALPKYKDQNNPSMTIAPCSSSSIPCTEGYVQRRRLNSSTSHHKKHAPHAALTPCLSLSISASKAMRRAAVRFFSTSVSFVAAATSAFRSTTRFWLRICVCVCVCVRVCCQVGQINTLFASFCKLLAFLRATLSVETSLMRGFVVPLDKHTQWKQQNVSSE